MTEQRFQWPCTTVNKNSWEKSWPNDSEPQQPRFDNPWKAKELSYQSYHNIVLIMSTSKKKKTHTQDIQSKVWFIHRKKSNLTETIPEEAQILKIWVKNVKSAVLGITNELKETRQKAKGNPKHNKWTKLEYRYKGRNCKKEPSKNSRAEKYNDWNFKIILKIHWRSSTADLRGDQKTWN